jgi:hypothetical protein
METSKKGRKQGKKGKKAKKKADNRSNREPKSDDEAQKQRAVARLDPEEQEQRREQEQPVDTVRQAEEQGVLESESHDMIDHCMCEQIDLLQSFLVKLNNDSIILLSCTFNFRND